MAARTRSRGGRRRAAASHDNEERWLLTYADMITLLMALFMVLFSISSVNISKYETLQQSLKAAFSGSILPGGRAILQSGSESTSVHRPATAQVPSIVPLVPTIPKPIDISSAQLQAAEKAIRAANAEQQSFVKLKQRLDAYAKAHGFSSDVRTVIAQRGLVVRVLTDKVLFDSGQADLKPIGLPLLNEVAQLLNLDQAHPILVEGHTDNQPISTAQFPSNWELSTARATTVVRYLISRGIKARRLSAAGYADLHPIATNSTPQGRQFNRRVEIVLQRLNPYPTS
jgi:chemotaxis protein MotB